MEFGKQWDLSSKQRSDWEKIERAVDDEREKQRIYVFSCTTTVRKEFVIIWVFLLRRISYRHLLDIYQNFIETKIEHVRQSM